MTNHEKKVAYYALMQYSQRASKAAKEETSPRFKADWEQEAETALRLADQFSSWQ